MKTPDKQTRTGENGDCLRAAFAAVLGIPIREAPDITSDDWFEEWARWFAARGLGLIWYGFKDGVSYHMPGRYVLSVDSPRLPGKTHAVVAQDGLLWFDPHPQADRQPADLSTARGCYLLTMLRPKDVANPL